MDLKKIVCIIGFVKNNDPTFWPDGSYESDLKKTMFRNRDEALAICTTQWSEADTDQRFYMGDSDVWGTAFPGISPFRRRGFNFNIINPMIQSITGFQRQNRNSLGVIPIKNGVQKTADQLTKCLYYVESSSNLSQVCSDAFEQGALVQGCGLVGFYKDTSNDPVSGELKCRYLDFKSVIFDPYLRDWRRFSDCRYIWTAQFFDRQELALMYPDHEEQILALPRGQYRNPRFYFMPENYQVQYPNLMCVEEYWYLSTREALFLVDTLTDECQEFQGDEEDLRDVLTRFKGRIKTIKKPRSTVRRAILVNDKVMVDEPNPYGMDRYPFAMCVGYFSPDTPYWNLKYRGPVRDLRAAQYLYTRMKISSLDILDSQQQGLKVKKGALVTPDDSLNTGHGRVLWIDPKHMMSDVEPMPVVPPPPQMLQMEEMLLQTAHRVIGIDPAAMGMDMNDKAALISVVRQAASARGLQRLFDQFDEFYKMCGEIACEFIQKNWSYGKVKQVIGEEPTAEFDNKLFFQYGCKVVQEPLTEAQKQLEMLQLLHLREIGIPVPAKNILQAATAQNKDELIKTVEAQEKAQAEAQQQMQQLQMQQMQIQNQATISYSHSQDGLDQERRSKIRTNNAIAIDKLRKSSQEDTASMLNLVKAVKELDGLDLDNLLRKLQILSTMNDRVEEKNVEGFQDAVSKVTPPDRPQLQGIGDQVSQPQEMAQSSL